MNAQVEDALAPLAPLLAPGGRDIAGLTRLTGGASLETWGFDVLGAGPARSLILRRRAAADAQVFETSLPLSTEAAVIAAAERAGAPVARLLRDCRDRDGLGEAYIVERVEGETLGRRIASAPAFAPARDLLAGQCGRALAAIHATPPADLPPLETLDAAASVERYAAIHRRGGVCSPVMEAAFARLRRTAPGRAPSPPQLVHGDFRNGNLIVDPQEGLRAVLDWELAHLGDPAEDIGWLCVNSWRFGETQRVVGGFADLEPLLDAYAAAGGARLDTRRLHFWMLMGVVRWAVVIGMMVRAGGGTSAQALERAVIGRRLSECEVDMLALMEADDGRA